MAIVKQCGCEVDDVTGVIVIPCPDQDVPVTVGRRACGCCVAVSTVPGVGDGPEKFLQYAKDITRWNRDGLVLEPRTVGWVRHTTPELGGLRWCRHRLGRTRS